MSETLGHDRDSDDNRLVGVTRSVIEQFLEELQQADVDPSVVERLRITILQKGKFSESALKTALFPEE